MSIVYGVNRLPVTSIQLCRAAGNLALRRVAGPVAAAFRLCRSDWCGFGARSVRKPVFTTLPRLNGLATRVTISLWLFSRPRSRSNTRMPARRMRYVQAGSSLITAIGNAHEIC